MSCLFWSCGLSPGVCYSWPSLEGREVWVRTKRAREQGGPRRACEPKKKKKQKL